MQIVLLVIAFACVAVGVLLIASARKVSATGRRFDAEVAGYVQTLSKKGSRNYAPVLSFRHPRAGRCHVQHATGSNSLPHEIGQRGARGGLGSAKRDAQAAAGLEACGPGRSLNR